MKKNLGTIDRVIRVLIAVLFAVLYITNVISGTLGIILMAVGVVFALTSLVSFCPLYWMFGLRTSKKE
jgi:hypothetical protein